MAKGYGIIAIAALAAIGTPAHAQAPFIDNNTATRTHSSAECMRRAVQAAEIRGFRVTNTDERSVFSERPGGTVKLAVHCDIPNITLFIAAATGGVSPRVENDANETAYNQAN